MVSKVNYFTHRIVLVINHNNMNQTLINQLFDSESACQFDPFQAIRLLELVANDPPAGVWHEAEFTVYCRANVSMAFPSSLIAQILPSANGLPEPTDLSPKAKDIRGRYNRKKTPTVVLNFFGLFGPQGALPLSYTRILCELDNDRYYRRTSTRSVLRDWLDIFNNRLMSLLYYAWHKYRLPASYLRTFWQNRCNGDFSNGGRTDKPTQILLSVIGLGVSGLKNRIRVEDTKVDFKAKVLARIDDIALLHYAGAFARRRPGEYELETILMHYFQIPIRVVALTGQWLNLPQVSQTRLIEGCNASLGVNTVVGDQIWDYNSIFRIRLGPLRYEEFVSFLPDPTPVSERKGVFLLCQLTRLYVGPEFDFEIQLVLKKNEIPDCVIQEVEEGQLGIRLGWNTWLASGDMIDEVDDVLFLAKHEVILPVTI
jgi:type VI secretion system protein ImpH